MALTIDHLIKSSYPISLEPSQYEPSADVLVLARDGCVGAVGDIIAANEGLVVRISRKYRKWLELDDAMQIARIAMMVKVIPNFDPVRGSWGAFAGLCMRRRLQHVTSYGSEEIRVKDEFEPRVWDGPVVREPRSYDMKRLRRIMDVFAADPAFAAEHADEVSWQAAEVARRMTKLTPRQRAIIEMRYGLAGETPRTYMVIAVDFGISHQAVTEVARKAIRKLQQGKKPSS